VQSLSHVVGQSVEDKLLIVEHGQDGAPVRVNVIKLVTKRNSRAHPTSNACSLPVAGTNHLPLNMHCLSSKPRSSSSRDDPNCERRFRNKSR
jgi:hypothetical protein